MSITKVHRKREMPLFLNDFPTSDDLVFFLENDPAFFKIYAWTPILYKMIFLDGMKDDMPLFNTAKTVFL